MANLVDLGKVALTLGGVWNSTTNYERLTYVLHENDGCGYVSLVSNVGVTPGTDASVWQKASLAGKSIYQLCVQHGTFVGTEEEFVAQYNAAVTAAQNAAATATETNRVVSEAESARVTAESGRVSAENERVNAEGARVNAESSRQLSETARENAFAISKAACDGATESAGAAALLANQKAALANDAASLANDKATLANQKAALANDAAALATELNEHQPRINQSTFHWEVWDADNNTYVDTGIMACSSPFATFEIDQTTGQLVMSTDATYSGPDFSLNESTGELVLSI